MSFFGTEYCMSWPNGRERMRSNSCQYAHYRKCDFDFSSQSQMTQNDDKRLEGACLYLCLVDSKCLALGLSSGLQDDRDRVSSNFSFKHRTAFCLPNVAHQTPFNETSSPHHPDTSRFSPLPSSQIRIPQSSAVQTRQANKRYFPLL